MPHARFTRAQMLALGGAGIFAGAVRARAADAASSPPVVDTGSVGARGVEFPAWTAPSDPPQTQPPRLLPPRERVGFAIIGLGRLSLENILPAFGKSLRAKPVALVSGSPDKARFVASQYGIAANAVYSYANFEEMRENPEIQAVYIVLPNSMHREYVVRAARIGKHVLCEKPMATSPRECEEMIAACRAARRLLMIAYRCQYDVVNRALLRIVRERRYGATRAILAANVQDMTDARQWRLHRAMAGGGSLVDVGIYCINAARFLTGLEPVEVFARTESPAGDPRFREVEDTASFMLRFPDGTIAQGTSSYGLHQSRTLAVHAERGAISLQNAFAYSGARLSVAHLDGSVETNDERRIEQHDQFALELDHFAECVATGRTPHTPGEEGLADHVVMDAVYRSASSGMPIRLPGSTRIDATRGPAPSTST